MNYVCMRTRFDGPHPQSQIYALYCLGKAQVKAFQSLPSVSAHSLGLIVTHRAPSTMGSAALWETDWCYLVTLCLSEPHCNW